MHPVVFANDDSMLADLRCLGSFLNHVQYNICLLFFVMHFVVLTCLNYLSFHLYGDDTLLLILYQK